MNGYSPKLPLVLDPIDGFRLTKTVKEVIKQNLKMLILTSPGERVMVPYFGVGLYNFLFELNTQAARSSIRTRIRHQVKNYMPFVNILDISFGDEEGMGVDESVLAVVIKYSIPSGKGTDVLRLNVD